MARRLRIQYPGAIYHVINRGNYRTDVFGSVGAAQAFERTLGEASEQFAWRIHAFVIMRNHFHLALETPQPNLVEGMHWLQSTYGCRFNRYRGEQGHLFQGRYRSLLIEDAAALVRVVDYIHLNPVRAGIVVPSAVATFRWSSLLKFVRGGTPPWLDASDWRTQLRLEDSGAGWKTYVDRLVVKAATGKSESDRNALCRGWAIGSAGWRKAIAEEHRHLALHRGVAPDEIREFKEARWEAELTRALKQAGRSRDSIAATAKTADWKCDIAAQLRRNANAPHAWVARVLAMGSPDSVRSLLSARKGSILQYSG